MVRGVASIRSRYAMYAGRGAEAAGELVLLRKGLIDAGFEPSMDPLSEFFVGRNRV